MRYIKFMAILYGVATAVSFRSPVYDPAKHTMVSPGGVDDIIITEDNTLNGTFHSSKSFVTVKKAFTASTAGAKIPMPIILNNSYKNGAKAFISGKDYQNRLVFIKGNGDVYYPSSGGSAIPVPISDAVVIPLPPVGHSITINLPINVQSGRVWFGDSAIKFFVVKTPAGDGLVQPSPGNLQDANGNIEWGFVEFTLDMGPKLFANPTYVDFVGVGAALKINDSHGQLVTKGLPSDSAAGICFGVGLIGYGEGHDWSKTCVFSQGKQLRRVLSPNQLTKSGDDTLATYLDPYVTKVWSHFSSNDLRINTIVGSVTCRVSSGILKCTGTESFSFDKPTTPDIWACDGVTLPNQGSDLKKAVAARLCAAFWRATFLVKGGNVQPGPAISQYYDVDSSSSEQCGRYAQVIHSQEFDYGYAFPYDDVRPDGTPDQSGTISSDSATSLTVIIGGLPRQ